MAKTVKTQRDESVLGPYLSEPQVEKLLSYVKTKADLRRQRGATRAIVDELIVLLLLNMGLRASEVCNLSIRDLPASHGENAVWVCDAQHNVIRKVDISSEIVNYLQRFVSLYRNGAPWHESLLVSGRANRPNYTSLYSKVRNIGKKATIGKLHPHTLRRTFLVRLYNVPLPVVKTEGRHCPSIFFVDSRSKKLII